MPGRRSPLTLLRARPRAADIAILAAVAVACCLPLLLFGIPKPSHDGAFHALAAQHFSSQLLAGDAYPRWLADMNAGYGAPVFFYYPPIPYYAATLTSLLTVWTADPWLEIGFALFVAIMLSGITLYAWMSELVGRRAALAAAVVYMIAPYHLAIDGYVRGAYAEVWAFVWLPLVLIGIRRNSVLAGVALTAAAVALLLMTHLPTSLLFAPFAAAYVLFTSWQRRSVKPAAAAAAGALLGAAIAAVYILPALQLRDAVLMDTMSSGAYSVPRWFLFGEPVSRLKNQLAFLLTTTIGAILAGEMIARASTNGTAARRFWVVTGLAAYALMTVHTRAIWERVPLAHEVQFPWRLGTVLTLAAAAVTGLTLNGSRVAYRELPAILRFVFLPGIALTWIAFTFSVMRPGTLEDWSRLLFDSATAPVEYRTRESEWLWRTRTDNGRTLLPGAPRATLVDDDGSVTLLDWRPRRIRARTSSPDSTTLEIRQLHFPGWTAASHDRSLTVRPSPLGLIWIDMPPGDHDVGVRLAPTRPEHLGARITLLASGIWLLVAVAAGLRRAPERAGGRSAERSAAPQTA